MNWVYRKASLSDLNALWADNIARNPGDPRYLRWRDQFIADNVSGAAATFVAVVDGQPVGEGTLLFSPDCRAIRGRRMLADGKSTANVNALRIRKEYEGQGHISRLMQAAEQYAKDLGFTHLTIGVEMEETRNQAIYHHWGFDEPVLSETEDGAQILYYRKALT